MAEIVWTEEGPRTWNAKVNDQLVCELKGKDIGGWSANWQGGRVWPPPAHLPKAMPQPTKFFSTIEEAKTAVEQALQG